MARQEQKLVLNLFPANKMPIWSFVHFSSNCKNTFRFPRLLADKKIFDVWESFHLWCLTKGSTFRLRTVQRAEGGLKLTQWRVCNGGAEASKEALMNWFHCILRDMPHTWRKKRVIWVPASDSDALFWEATSKLWGYSLRFILRLELGFTLVCFEYICRLDRHFIGDIAYLRYCGYREKNCTCTRRSRIYESKVKRVKLLRL